MTTITIALNINKRTALRKGKREAGQITVTLPDGLTTPQLEELSYWTKDPHGASLDNYFYLMMPRKHKVSDPRQEIFDSIADYSPESISFLLDQLAAVRKSRLAEVENEERKEREQEEARQREVEEKCRGLSVDDLIVEHRNHRAVHAGEFSEKYSSFDVQLPKNYDVGYDEFWTLFPERWEAAKEEVRRRREEAKKQAREIVDRRQEKAKKDRDEWIRTHGSSRLQMILEEGLLDSSMAVYRDEMLAYHRPGWIWDDDWYDGEVEHEDTRNPTEGDLLWLRKMREKFPECELVYGYLNSSEPQVREVILVDKYLGKIAVLRRDVDTTGLDLWKRDTTRLLKSSEAKQEMASAMAAWVTAEYDAVVWESLSEVNYEYMAKSLVESVKEPAMFSPESRYQIDPPLCPLCERNMQVERLVDGFFCGKCRHTYTSEDSPKP
jgi:predicted secreted protein